MLRATLSLLLLTLVASACNPLQQGNAPRGLVFISLDTVRRDHLPVYGYARNTTPRIAALASRAVVFEDAYTQETNTNPSHTSMFTGLYPIEHGSLANGRPLRAGQKTLAGILRDKGFRTAGFVSGVTMRREASGLDRGFELYGDQFKERRRDGRIATKLAQAWLAKLAPDERFFLFLHSYDAHGPYNPRPGFEGQFVSETPGMQLPRIPPYQRKVGPDGRVVTNLNFYVDNYDDAIRYTDSLVTELLADVDLSEVIVVILSDHGETLGERFHVLDHGGQVFDEQLRIPLLIAAPGIPARRVSERVETVDLLPTLLALLEVPVPSGLPVTGHSLVPLMKGAAPSGKGLVFASARAVSARHADRGYDLDIRRRIHSVRSDRWKLILYPGVKTDYVELYDLAADPGEKVNVAAEHEDVRAAYMQALASWARGETPALPGPAMDEQTRRQLEELGYLERDEEVEEVEVEESPPPPE